MTQISNTWSFEGLPRIYLVTSDYNIETLGFYDPEWSRDTEFAYQPGRFTNPDGSPRDAPYRDHQAIVVAFKHPIFGNYPGLRNMVGHFHYKYIVSTTIIRPHDVLRADPNTQDIYIFADLAKNPPITEIRDDNTQETLYEITPHLTPELLARLPKEIKFATKMQEKMHRLEKENFELETKLVLTQSTAVAAQSSAFLYREQVESALTNQRINEQKFLQLQLLVGERLTDSIEDIEKTHFLNLNWDNNNHKESKKLLERTQETIRDISSTVKLMGSPTDAQKYQVLMMAVNMVGIPFAQKFMQGITQFTVSTPTGIENLTISKEPGLQEIIFHYQKLYENNQISWEEKEKAITEALDRDRARRRKTDSPNAATQETRKDILRVAGVQEAQTQHGK